MVREIVDQPDHWRVIGTKTVTAFRVLDFLDRNSKPNGVQYAIGPDPVSGSTKIAWIQYPKKVFSRDEIATMPEIDKILQRCNVCSAADQLAAAAGTSLITGQPSQAIQPFQEEPPKRLSIGDALGGSDVMPKWAAFVLNMGSKQVFSPLGQTMFFLGLSFLADMASGMAVDEGYKRALQCMSDGMVNNIGTNGQCDTQYMSQVNRDVAKLVEAWQKDGDLIKASKVGLLKTPQEIMMSAQQGVEGNVSFSARAMVRKLDSPTLIE